MLSKIYSAGISGIDGFIVTAECDTRDSLDSFQVVGLPDTVVKEAKERVTAACENSGFPFPYDAITVSLAPADRRKEGSAFDLPIIIGILRSSGIINSDIDLSSSCFVGELSLSGDVRGVRGVICMCAAAKEAGMTDFYVPAENASEAAAVTGINVYGVRNVRQLVDHLEGRYPLTPTVCDDSAFDDAVINSAIDFSDVKGQSLAKRAMEIAAAGGHNILLIGPPGTGKSMLAKRLPTILPPLTVDEAIETTKIHSVAATLPDGVSLLSSRPFRSPHHTMSSVSLVGGGTNPMPGEISLAHNGVLFLDELPEFQKIVTDSLRQPLEDRKVTITRASGRVTYPCSFMLVCAMNPCRCGYFGHPTKKCTCKPDDVKRYISKISGPLLDRIDIEVELPSLPFEQLSESKAPSESSADIRERVVRARKFALGRMNTEGGNERREKIFCNAQLDAAGIRRYCITDDAASNLLKSAYNSLGLSARGYDRIMRVARTIADLEQSEIIHANHIAEAIQLRSLDKKYWGN